MQGVLLNACEQRRGVRWQSQDERLANVVAKARDDGRMNGAASDDARSLAACRCLRDRITEPFESFRESLPVECGSFTDVPLSILDRVQTQTLTHFHLSRGALLHNGDEQNKS